MAEIFTEGFDKYGVSGSVASLMLGEWNTAYNISIEPALSSTGYAVGIGDAGCSKTLPGNFSRLIGGIRFQSSLGGSVGANAGGVTFCDGGGLQAYVAVISGTGWIQIGGFSGVTAVPIATTTTISVKENSTHYLEWDITFGASGAYLVYLDGVLILSGNGATNNTGHNYANQFVLHRGNGFCIYDDLYLFDSTGPTNNAVLMTNPRIETQFPIADSQTQFLNGGSILGNIISSSGDSYGVDEFHLNNMYLIPLISPVNQTLESVGISCGSSPIDNWTVVVYSDNAGIPDTLLAQSADTAGSTALEQIFDLLAPLSLVASTKYWIGIMFFTDILINTSGYIGCGVSDNLLGGVHVARTYSSGPPGIASAMSIGGATFLFHGYCSNPAHNWVSENRNPPPSYTLGSDSSFIYSSTPGNEDLYTFPALTTHPTIIYTVAVKAYVKLTDTGNRSVDLRMKSVATDSAGSLAGQIPSTSYEWVDSFFDTDPHTSAAWTEAGLNSAVSGIKVAS
jgi:hypothetical protein